MKIGDLVELKNDRRKYRHQFVITGEPVAVTTVSYPAREAFGKRRLIKLLESEIVRAGEPEPEPSGASDHG